MTTPVITTIDFGGPRDAPLLLLGPSLGTSVTALWSTAAHLLTARHRVVGFDLPGHGRSPAPTAAFTIADVAYAVHEAAVTYGSDRYHYAGVSAGGAVGLELLLRHGDSISSATLICTAAKIRTTAAWLERAQLVRSKGTAVMLASATSTWFADGFTDRDPDTAAALLTSLHDTTSEGYAAICEALAQFDVRQSLEAITNDVTAISGSHDIATPPSSLRYLAEHIPRCRYLELADAAHLAPAEQPALIADELLAITHRSPL